MSQQENGSLGDITRIINDSPIQDLNWLSLTPGENYDNIPSDFNREIIPQLEAQWGSEHYENPFYLVPSKANIVVNEENTHTISPEQIVEVVNVTKRDMMNGLSGREVAASLRDRYPSRVIQAAASELKKVAAEEGLLGNVYVDLSAFNSTKEALDHLGHHRVRTASFAVGSPKREKDFVDSFGRCRNLAKTVVASVDYTPAVLAHYETHLKNLGTLAKTASLTSKEDLKNAFLAAKKANSTSVSSDKQEAVFSVPSDEEASSAMASLKDLSEIKDSQEAASMRMASARPVLAKIQGLMLRGLTGDALKQSIRLACTQENLVTFKPEISKLANLQGLIGPLFVDIAAYADTKTACEAIASSYIRPKYIVSSMATPMGFSDKIASLTGLPVFTRDTLISQKTAAEIILALEEHGKIDNVTAANYLDKLSKEQSSVLNLVREATAAANCKAPEVTSEAPAEMTASQPVYQGTGEVQAPQVDREAIKTASLRALNSGVSITAIRGKIASMVPVGEALGIVREAVASLTVVSTDVLDGCHSEKYALAANAKLASTGKCANCVFHVGPACSRQGRPFENEHLEAPSMDVHTVDPSHEMGLQNGNLVINLDKVVIPARSPITGMEPLMGNRPTMGNIL